MDLIKNFTELNKNDTPIAGGKGASLGEMTQAGIPVSQAHTIDRASEDIQALILKAEMPKDIAVEIQAEFKKLNSEYVAVRSSATAEDGTERATRVIKTGDMVEVDADNGTVKILT